MNSSGGFLKLLLYIIYIKIDIMYNFDQFFFKITEKEPLKKITKHFKNLIIFKNFKGHHL